MIRAMLELRIQQHFIDSGDLHYQLSETLAKPVEAAVQALLASVTGGGKVLVVGLGPSLPLAQYFTGLLVGGFERQSPLCMRSARKPTAVSAVTEAPICTPRAIRCPCVTGRACW